jgi:hypothetical protein
MEQHNHTAAAPDASDRDSALPSSPVANPRRTRVGSDGRPTRGQVRTATD